MNQKYPLGTMEVGEVFIIPLPDTKGQGYTYRSYMYAAGKKLGKKFVTKKIVNGDEATLEVKRVS